MTTRFHGPTGRVNLRKEEEFPPPEPSHTQRTGEQVMAISFEKGDGSANATDDARDLNDPNYNPRAALSECYDCWASGAWPDSNAQFNLEEVMLHIARLLGRHE